MCDKTHTYWLEQNNIYLMVSQFVTVKTKIKSQRSLARVNGGPFGEHHHHRHRHQYHCTTKRVIFSCSRHIYNEVTAF